MAEYKSQVWRVNVRDQTLKLEPLPDTWERLGGRGSLHPVCWWVICYHPQIEFL